MFKNELSSNEAETMITILSSPGVIEQSVEPYRGADALIHVLDLMKLFRGLRQASEGFPSEKEIRVNAFYEGIERAIGDIIEYLELMEALDEMIEAEEKEH